MLDYEWLSPQYYCVIQSVLTGLSYLNFSKRRYRVHNRERLATRQLGQRSKFETIIISGAPLFFMINYSYHNPNDGSDRESALSVDSSDRSNLMRAFIIGNGINRARLSYDLMDALSSDRPCRRAAHATRVKKRPRRLGPTDDVVITTNYCYLYSSNRSAVFIYRWVMIKRHCRDTFGTACA